MNNLNKAGAKMTEISIEGEVVAELRRIANSADGSSVGAKAALHQAADLIASHKSALAAKDTKIEELKELVVILSGKYKRLAHVTGPAIIARAEAAEARAEAAEAFIRSLLDGPLNAGTSDIARTFLSTLPTATTT